MGMYGASVADSRITCGKGKAKQSMRDECDVNLIMAQYVRTGFLSHVSAGLPQYVDISELTDYRSAIEHVRSVEEYFAGLPALVRTKFDNDAVAFMDYLDSGASEEDLEVLGREALGDRRARAQDEREGDSTPDPVVDPAPEVTPEPDGTLPT